MANKQKQIGEMTGEELAEALGKSYEVLVRVRDDIQIINREIQERKQRKATAEKELTDDTGKSQ